MFGFKYQADQVYEKPHQINEIKIVDQNGNDFDIVSVNQVDNVTTYKIKALNFAKINFQKNDLFQNYKTEFKKRMFGKDNG